MTADCIYFVIDLAINDGKLTEFEKAVAAMNEGTAKEPGALAYDWFLTADRKRCRLLETYADAAAARAHINGHVVQQLVPQLLQSSKIERFEVYGAPDEHSATLLRSIGAEIFAYWSGISARHTSAAKT